MRCLLLSPSRCIPASFSQSQEQCLTPQLALRYTHALFASLSLAMHSPPPPPPLLHFQQTSAPPLPANFKTNALMDCVSLSFLPLSVGVGRQRRGSFARTRWRGCAALASAAWAVYTPCNKYLSLLRLLTSSFPFFSSHCFMTYSDLIDSIDSLSHDTGMREAGCGICSLTSSGKTSGLAMYLKSAQLAQR